MIYILFNNICEIVNCSLIGLIIRKDIPNGGPQMARQFLSTGNNSPAPLTLEGGDRGINKTN